MSAIAGILSYHCNAEAVDDRFKLMNALLKYPADRVDTWNDGSVFLGCHAQWITPESRFERLPYYDQHNQLAITADAIIDNRDELFNRLQVDNARRRQMTDSELILLAYRKWEQQAPHYLIGDFAFVIWDEKKRQLFAARDLSGNRTLYYNHDHCHFAFCTAINPLLTLSLVQKEWNESWLAEFLAIPIILDSIDVHSTVYRHIHQIPPAHSITVSDGKIALEQYGSLSAPNEKLKLRTSGEYEEAFRAVFQEAVSSKLRTYRQVGASLSGGLDSGAVVSFAANPLRNQGKTLHTYSYVPPADFVDWTSRTMIADELPYIQATVEHVGNIQDHYLPFADRDSFAETNDLLSLLETPYKFFENSFWIKGILEQAQNDGVGVLLTGAGGNYTISWGPAMDYYAQLLRKLRWLRLYRELKQYGSRMKMGRARLLRIIGKQAFPFASLSSFSKRLSEEPQLIHPEFARKTNVLEKLKNHDVGLSQSSLDEFAAREYQFENLAISNHQGTSITKFSLRYGVWERDPTNDPRVVRFCLSVPVDQFVRDGMDRALVRRATNGYLPDQVRLNQRVRGVQGADWIHRMRPVWREFTGELHKLCRDPSVSSFLNVNQIKESLRKIGDSPHPRQAFDVDARLLMRSLIVYRFMQQFS